MRPAGNPGRFTGTREKISASLVVRRLPAAQRLSDLLARRSGDRLAVVVP
jgi:hypothetical protein